MAKANRYQQIIEHIFVTHYVENSSVVPFVRQDIEVAARTLGIKLPKNLGDVLYSFRYRAELPEQVRAAAGEGHTWLIRSVGRGQYQFVRTPDIEIAPNPLIAETRLPDATPGMIAKYAMNDEQALLAKLRYNRLVDIFMRITCYSLQNHLRTTVPDMGQIETDELYVGIDRRGAHYVIPVQAKGGSDRLSIVQIEQDFALCSYRFPNLICRPIGVQFIDADYIALFAFELQRERISVVDEKHYRLVLGEEISPEDLRQYRQRTDVLSEQV